MGEEKWAAPSSRKVPSGAADLRRTTPHGFGEMRKCVPFSSASRPIGNGYRLPPESEGSAGGVGSTGSDGSAGGTLVWVSSGIWPPFVVRRRWPDAGIGDQLQLKLDSIIPPASVHPHSLKHWSGLG